MIKKTIVTLALTILTLGLQAQTQTFRENSKNTHAWFMYFGNHKLSKSIGLHAEVQVRRNDGISNWQQLLLRTGLDFYRPNARFTIGYAFVETYPYGTFPVANAFPEHRIWQQALVNQPLGRLKMSHRYRLEQRMLGNPATGEFKDGRYENRFRYMWRANIPLSGTTLEPKEFYLGFYDEIFINFGNQVGYNLFDQNRAYAAVGYHLGKLGRMEIGYLYQAVQLRTLDATVPPPRNKIENNHTFQVALISDIPFFTEKKD